MLPQHNNIIIVFNVESETLEIIGLVKHNYAVLGLLTQKQHTHLSFCWFTISGIYSTCRKNNNNKGGNNNIIKKM